MNRHSHPYSPPIDDLDNARIVGWKDGYDAGVAAERERWHDRINELLEWWAEVDGETPGMICGVLHRLKSNHPIPQQTTIQSRNRPGSTICQRCHQRWEMTQDEYEALTGDEVCPMCEMTEVSEEMGLYDDTGEDTNP